MPNKLTSSLEGEVETAGGQPGVEGGGAWKIPLTLFCDPPPWPSPSLGGGNTIGGRE